MKRFSGKKCGQIAYFLVVAMLATAFSSFTREGAMYAQAYSGREEKERALEENGEEISAQRATLKQLSSEQEILAIVYQSAEVDIYSQPSTESEKVLALPIGSSVMIRDVELELTEDADKVGNLWIKVNFFWDDVEYWGYVQDGCLMTADERYLAWKEDSVLAKLSQPVVTGRKKLMSVLRTVSGGDYSDVEMFPASYQDALTTLKNAHPNWVFIPYNTGLDWNTVIANEIGDSRSLVYKTLDNCMKEGLFDEGNWYYASEDALKYYMDPRNGLTEDRIFQFELLSFNATYHTQASLDVFLNNTFMNNSANAPKTDMKFSQIFWAIGKEQQVSPFHLAARVYQEQGQGTSPLISGAYAGYEGYYNYFNIGATGSTNKEVIENGLSYAKQKNWYSAYYSILGGTQVIAANYIQKQQDTLYLQKFNVTPNGRYWHQYMQNITAPATEALSIKKLYQSAGALENKFVFKIPVYQNMPASACPKPTSSMNIAIKAPTGYSGKVFLDGIEYNGVSRNGNIIITAPDKNKTTAVMYEYNENGVPVGMYLWTLRYDGNYYAVAAQPGLEDLLSYHGFSIRITGKAGIRFKTGISAALKNQLATTGVNGYTLKEYGTLVMTNSNRSEYPLIKDGEKVKTGISYGIEGGQAVDKVYETVDGRQRFTSVLVGLPASQYKTEFAFRGYAVLEKEGKKITVYGPIQTRSIYNLAVQVLAQDKYPEGSDAYDFLMNLVN